MWTALAETENRVVRGFGNERFGGIIWTTIEIGAGNRRGQMVDPIAFLRIGHPAVRRQIGT